MNDEQLLINEMNDFEDFMENADIEEIKREHGLTSSNEVLQGEIVESAEIVHKRILDNLKIVNNALYQIGLDLKYFRDNALYKQMGYVSFISYCNSELNMFDIKIRQVYNYISIVENLSSEFVQPVAQIGMRKLYCLSRLTSNERTKLIETTDLERTPVKEVEQKAKKIKENREVKQQNDNVKLFKSIFHCVGYQNESLIHGCFYQYNCKYKLSKDKNDIILNSLFDYYEYIVKMKKLFNIDLNSLSLDDFKDLDYVISDLIEVSRRFNSCLFDFKKIIKKYESGDKNA